MGRLFKVEYDQNTDTPYYVCRHCRTVITKDRDRYMTNRFSTKPVIYFATADNLVVGDEEFTASFNNVEVDVNCVECNSLLGSKLIRRGRSYGYVVGARIGSFAMFKDELLKWNGAEFVAADQGLFL